ncbi:MAG: enoyl-CoA hydratase/isomerase family protein [Pseudomonadota bacterium]
MIETSSHGEDIVELKLARPPVNALNPDLVRSLTVAIDDAESQGARGLVISGREGLFSAGLDVPELLTLDEQGMRDFWTSFFGLLEKLARSKLMVAAALTGHSPAGGTVVAMFCDYRVLSEGPFRLGLNEVQVGLVVPPVIHKGLVRLLGPYQAERHLVAGQMIDGESAHRIGLVDEIAPADAVVDRAVAWIDSHLKMSRHSLEGTRALCRADLAALFDDPHALDINGFVRGWFAADTQSSLKALAESLARR